MRMHSALPPSEIIVLGAGIIGLSIALELRLRGANVLVVDRGAALSQASIAAAGMLAVHDSHNPPQLRELSDFSHALYDEFLLTIRTLSGVTIPYQTNVTQQYARDRSHTSLLEHSLDPRQLAPALLEAALRSGVELREHFELNEFPADRQVIYTMGAWSQRFQVHPRKGQMLRVHLPPRHMLNEVHRAEHIYVVPRTQGPQAGTALIGATVEDVGFNTEVQRDDLLRLKQTAAKLDDSLSFLRDLETVEAWAGLRPSTPDDLPVIGRLNSHELVATGHFRNGILLAPATAKVVADLVESRDSPVILENFRPNRFEPAPHN